MAHSRNRAPMIKILPLFPTPRIQQGRCRWCRNDLTSGNIKRRNDTDLGQRLGRHRVLR